MISRIHITWKIKVDNKWVSANFYNNIESFKYK